MSRRKRSFPARLSQQIHSHLEFPLESIADSPESEPKTCKRVSFRISDSSDNNLIECENYVKFKRKKIYKTFPPDSVVLGDLSFPIHENKKIDFELDDVNYYVLVNDSEEFLELSLKICSDNNISKHFNLVITSEVLLKTINDLMHHRYYWVINEENSLKAGILNVSITTTPKKTPIPKSANIVKLFFGKSFPMGGNKENYCASKTSIADFYREIKNFRNSDESQAMHEKDVQHEKLVPKLRPYQAKAVQWMIFRERNESQQEEVDWLASVVETFKSKCGKNIYYNKYADTLLLSVEKMSTFTKGGILADEMGLGKTVAMISLILNNGPEPESAENGDFQLPRAKEGSRIKTAFKSSERARHKNEKIAKNKEEYMDADEKLICNKVSRGPALKRALREWYESKLSEYSAASPSKMRRMGNDDDDDDDDSVKCICGNVGARKNEKFVQCPICKKYQHGKCVGFDEIYTYFCPSCWSKQKLVKSNGTLIIAPASIHHQWFEEIGKHVKADGFQNGVFMYNGLKEGFVQPSVLAANDVVIATYATIRAEVNHTVQDESGRKLRNEERFLKMSSPLRQIHWWRLCLDEAQMVENDHSQINQMVNIISAVNRWSVTGTPIQKSINELFYLVEWLGIEPFVEKSVWNDFLYRPYANGNKIPLHSIVAKVLWRNSKEDVANELMLPEQKVKCYFLKFTAIEQNFYMREHTVSSLDFAERLKKVGLNGSRTIDSVDKTTLTSLLAPLLNLRQACSHPMAVKGSKIYSKTGNVTLTELLQYLFNKTKSECEETMRQHVAALNGLAGIQAILNDWPGAVGYYREVLRLNEEYGGKIVVDSLQRIHAMTNLAELLQVHPEGISPTLRDDSLKAEAQALEDKYMENSISDLNSDENLLKGLTNKVRDLEKRFETSPEIWWNRLIHLLTIEGSMEDFKNKMKTELSTSEADNRKQVDFFLGKISSAKGIEIMLRNWLSGIRENRNKSLKNLETLRGMNQETLVCQAVDCHLRTYGNTDGKRKKCQLCVCESVLLDYECSLFDVSRKALKETYEKVLDGAQTKGSWRAQKAERCLRALLNVSKSKSNIEESWCLNDGKIHLLLLEAMKKEFKQLRAVWMSLNHRIQALDEISMCKLRLRLRLPDESIPPRKTNLSLKCQNKIETIFIVEEHELESQRLKLLGELQVSKSEFKKKHGTLLYLKNLGQKENPKPEPCPICKVTLDNEWCVLQCGHSYCIDCIRILLTRSPKPCLGCPVCREVTKSTELGFIDLSGKHDDSDVDVAGDHSTKVDGIVRNLLRLKRSDPKVKVLIFSTWSVVLKVMEVALTQNGISFRRMPGHNYQVHLKQFKDPDLNVTALLLPLSWGSKGLNLVESNHVFLVEPITNPSEESQAIGRIHRIGQTRETFVHRFLIGGTIEEKIQSSVSEAKDKWGQKKVTLEDLKNLFDMKNDLLTSRPPPAIDPVPA